MTCDVLIAGGGPAGSSCAWALTRAGLDVIVLDSATFPRDKVCAGWITPQVVAELQLDLQEYRHGRTCQPITGFRTGVIGSESTVSTSYHETVSYGIRRCEFDEYLLRRSGARVFAGTPLTDVRREGRRWVVNEEIHAAMLVGAGGHFCPIARRLNGRLPDDNVPLVVAQEAEFAVDGQAYATAPEQPELYFCDDMKGYGWCFRKQRHLNIGLGRLDRHSLPRATKQFVDFITRLGRVPRGGTWPWRGHAYLLHRSPRTVVTDGALLIGDAAGLAYPESGEGIRPAVESGLVAAATMAECDGDYSASALDTYRQRLLARFGEGNPSPHLLGAAGQKLAVAAAKHLLHVPWFVRRVVLDRWFLHANVAALAV